VGALRDFFGKEPKRTMNSEEAVAKGCALQVVTPSITFENLNYSVEYSDRLIQIIWQAAMISPNFKVREFSIADSTPYAIALSWSASAQVMRIFRILCLVDYNAVFSGRSYGNRDRWCERKK
jgi:molecular chaperone DnaK (HSP70)